MLLASKISKAYLATRNLATRIVTSIENINFPRFTTQPTSQNVAEAGDAVFTSEASGDPTPTYQWEEYL